MTEEIKFKTIHWTNIKDPEKEEIFALGDKYGFHELDLEDCISETQRPKIDEYENYLFIILKFPHYNRKTRHITAERINIFISQDFLITIHMGKLDNIKDIFEHCEKSSKYKKEFFGETTGYLLYSLINEVFKSSFKVVDKVQIKLEEIEKEIFETSKIKDQLFEIMVTKKNIISLRKILAPQRTVIASLEHKQTKFLPDNLEIYFDDIVDQIEKLWTHLESQKEVIESLEDTNESMLSHNINNTIRTLTVFSAIMLPLTFLTGLFGMNVRLPFHQALDLHQHFWSIIISMLLTALIMIGVFKWKKWL